MDSSLGSLRRFALQLASSHSSSSSLNEGSSEDMKLFGESLRKRCGLVWFALRSKSVEYLCIRSEGRREFPARHIEGALLSEGRDGSGTVLVLPAGNEAVDLLKRYFPELLPTPLGPSISSFGIGDRLGCAGPGQLFPCKKSSFIPVPAQESMRELELTGRSYRSVVDDALWGVFKSGYRGPWGAFNIFSTAPRR